MDKYTYQVIHFLADEIAYISLEVDQRLSKMYFNTDDVVVLSHVAWAVCKSCILWSKLSVLHLIHAKRWEISEL